MLLLATATAAQTDPPPAIEAALLALAKDDHVPAMAYLQRSWPTEPKERAAAEQLFVKLAAWLHASKDVPRALTLLGELANMKAQIAPGYRARAAALQGDLAIRAEDYDLAIRALRLCADTDSYYNSYTAPQLASLYLDRGAVADAFREVEVFKNVPGVDPSKVAVREAEVLLAAGQCDAAARALVAGGFAARPKGAGVTAATQDPTAILAQELWVDIALWSEQFADAIASIEQLKALGIDSDRLRFGQAIAQQRLNDPAGLISLRAIAKAQSVRSGYRSKAGAIVVEHHLLSGDPAAAAATLELLPADSTSLELDIARARLALARYTSRSAKAAVGGVTELEACAQALDRRWLDLIRQWSDLPVFPGGVAFLQIASRRDLLSACLECDAVLLGDAAASVAWARLLTVDAQNTLARQQGLAAVAVADIRRHVLPPNGAVVAYLPARGRSHVLWLTDSDAAVLRMPSDLNLRADVQSLRSELQRANIDRGRSLARLHELAGRIASVVLPAALVERLAAVDRVAIHGRELVAGLPFACLPWPRAERSDFARPYLGLCKALHYQPCLTLATELATQPQPELTIDLMVAAAASHEDDARRHGVAATTLPARRLAQLQPAASKATRQAVLPVAETTAAALFDPGESVGALAVFAHGIFDAKRAQPAGLLLARGDNDTGDLFADGVPEDARPPARMVVLCTCGAARGSLQRGDEGSRHLGGVLMQLGTRVVGIADGDLEVRGTERLITELFAELSYGEPPDQALLAARRTLAADGHLADWSLVRLEGLAGQQLLAPAHTEPTRPPRARPRRWSEVFTSPWVALVAVSALLLVWLSRRKRATTAT